MPFESFAQDYSNAALVISIFSIILSFTSLTISYKLYRVQKYTNVIRPHSNALAEEYSRWLDYIKHVLPAWYPISEGIEKSIEEMKKESEIIQKLLNDKGELEKSIFSGLSSAAKQHLETGYNELYRKLLNLANRLKAYDSEACQLFIVKCEDLKKKIDLPDRRGQHYLAYYSRIISYAIKKRYTGYPNGYPLPDTKRLNSTTLTELKWEGALLASGGSGEILIVANTIENIMNESNDMIDKLHKKFSTLRQEVTELILELENHLIETTRLGGLVKGKCHICGETP
ncbi:MAG: hypothetical protein QXD24_01985 [Candidatus Caldarchaeum sp.]|jgi:hypothetical protein